MPYGFLYLFCQGVYSPDLYFHLRILGHRGMQGTGFRAAMGLYAHFPICASRGIGACRAYSFLVVRTTGLNLITQWLT